MRNINYILINKAKPQTSRGKYSNLSIDNLGYHFVVGGDGVVRKGISIRQPGLFAGCIRNLSSFEQRDYNASSIGILVESDKLKWCKALLGLLRELRTHFPEAKILGTCEINGKRIEVSEAMNQLRRELSESHTDFTDDTDDHELYFTEKITLYSSWQV